ncbi:MAG: translation initiation factor IF-2 [Selenomonadaceae bacterium]|nr:translation initiation factor IF-2 [Selenomonadaceae bacterium]
MRVENKPEKTAEPVEKVETKTEKPVEKVETKTEKTVEKVETKIEKTVEKIETVENETDNEREQRQNRNDRGGRFNRADRDREKNISEMDQPERVEERSSRPERGDRTERKNRDSSREDGGKIQNRNRNRKNKNAANAAKTQQQQAQNQNVNRPMKIKKKNRPQPVQVHKAEIARPTHIKIASSILVKDLASKISCTAADIIKKLISMGVMATINQEIDFGTAEIVAAEFGVTAEELPPEVDPTLIPEIEDDPKSLKLRPPVVTVMGHVDHGKTSLLDAIRQSSVTATEAGGITQHIGAYQVMCKDKKIVFLDTPGHEAFTAMRARGAQVTDIAVLVVAADDGVMPQTVEAINHAKAAGVPIIVAVNKIDKPGANPAKVKQELMEYELVPEDYGGDTVMVEVSAKKRIGINDLLEMILLVAEVQELKANPNREARGVIIEAQLDKGRGSVATVLVQNGTLRVGDAIVAGTTYGHVRAMINDRGDNVKKAGPSVPVEVLGLSGVPAAGDILAALDEKLAKSIAEHRQAQQRTELIKSKKVSLDDLFNQIKAGEIKDLNILVKADVQGSVEALSSSLLGLNEKNDEVRVNIIHSGVGAVNESDIMLASAGNALIIAFNVRPDNNARKIADSENIDIRTYRVIYDAIGDVKAAMSGMLAPKYKEVIQGRVEIRKVMKFSKALVAGSYVLEGKIYNNSKIRLLRDNVEIFDGAIDSLRRFKDEVKEVAQGYECGISIVDFRDFREGDIIEAYTMQEIETSIED